MSFGSRLRDKRKELGITQPQLAKMLGVSQSAIGSWETDTNSPRATLLYDIFQILSCDANYLFQDETRELYRSEATPDEFENLVKKFRQLDRHGQETVLIILDRELERVNQLDLALSAQEEEAPEYPVRIISYYQRLASAGTGQVVFDDVPVDLIEIPDLPEYKTADYAIGVNGDSMEPRYHDGDILLVQSTPDLAVGQFGVVIVDGESYVKKLGDGELISLNKNYDPINITGRDVRVMGKVIANLSPEAVRRA